MVNGNGHEKRFADMVATAPDDWRVHVETYLDPAVFEQEMVRIFESWWMYVGHVSEVAEPGDYKTGFMGRQPIIVSRDRSGEIHVLLNTCRHRGNAVCREDYGNSMAFRCPYHGWTYANDGRLIGVTGRVRYPPGFTDRIDGLISAPRVGIRRGLIFASLSDRVPDFDEYLGPAHKYIDLWADASVGAEFRLSRPSVLQFRANWKTLMENLADGYHARFTHESGMKAIGYDPDADLDAGPPKRRLASDQGADISGGPGEGAGRAFELAPGLACVERGDRAAFGRPNRFRNSDLDEEYQALLQEAHGPERAEAILRPRHTMIFPNLFLLDRSLHNLQPGAPDDTVMYQHYVAPAGAGPFINDANLHEFQWRLGGAGLFATDDLEMFEQLQSGIQGRAVQWINLSRGLHTQEMNDDGELVGGPSDEMTQRALWKAWVRIMSAPADAVVT